MYFTIFYNTNKNPLITHTLVLCSIQEWDYLNHCNVKMARGRMFYGVGFALRFSIQWCSVSRTFKQF